MGEIETFLQKMEPIGLSEMQNVRLMNRVDTKYITNLSKIAELLSLCTDGYLVQSVDGSLISEYETLYYDTDSLDMYIRHHDRKLRRQKIRARTYMSSGLTFIEIKNKSNKGRTVKVRSQMSRNLFSDCMEDDNVLDFVGHRTGYDASRLSPSLQTSFSRITLVNIAKTERITIDMSLVFENIRTGRKAFWPGLAIIELKQDGSKPSDMKRLLCDLRIHPRKISKYCIGVAATDPDVKKNRFKCKLRYITKIT